MVKTQKLRFAGTSWQPSPPQTLLCAELSRPQGSGEQPVPAQSGSEPCFLLVHTRSAVSRSSVRAGLLCAVGRSQKLAVHLLCTGVLLKSGGEKSKQEQSSILTRTHQLKGFNAVEQVDIHQHAHVVCVCLEVVLVFALYAAQLPQCRSAEAARCFHKGGHPVNTQLGGGF